MPLIKQNRLQMLSNELTKNPRDNIDLVKKLCEQAWSLTPPVWPLKSYIARNPLCGFEHLAFDEALYQSSLYFEQSDIPIPMNAVNRETIKWCQAFFDEGQATFSMPSRHLGFYKAWKELAIFDTRLHHSNKASIYWLIDLNDNPEEAILECLQYLNIDGKNNFSILSFMLSSLPGWAGYTKYCVEWSPDHIHRVSFEDYIAVRLAITCLLWPEINEFKYFKTQASPKSHKVLKLFSSIQHNEEKYAQMLLTAIQKNFSRISNNRKDVRPSVQLVFCIDIRSEPFRRSLEALGNYETLGFAGFFGVPVNIHEYESGDNVASCPVLIKPQQSVEEMVSCSKKQYQMEKRRKLWIGQIKQFYQSLKYNFTTPFALAESLGIWCGLWMCFKTLMPSQALNTKKILFSLIRPPLPTKPSIKGTSNATGIDFENQCQYAENALLAMGLTKNFAPLVVLCGHGSETQNNAYAAALDCGACGGRHGGLNGQLLATILNENEVRKQLALKGILIPHTTWFVGAEHNTTTDEVIIYSYKSFGKETHKIEQQLKKDLYGARLENAKSRSGQMGYIGRKKKAIRYVKNRSCDWAQTRPEWGLARNACFIIGPRSLTKNTNLQGRSFLHSYDWQQDKKGSYLEVIMTAPMIVAHWINSQYFFSTLNNIAYGSGSKITQNITGKIGIMQGNSSDLMHGLPLQSVYLKDGLPFHEPLRLLTVIYAPLELIESTIKKHDILKKLFGNSWINLAAINPKDNSTYILNTNFTWKKVKITHK